MAVDATVGFAKHGTLVANTVYQVAVTDNSARQIEVYNRSTTGNIFFTTNSKAPTLLGDDTFIVGPQSSVVAPSPQSPDDVRLICATANDFSITGTIS